MKSVAWAPGYLLALSVFKVVPSQPIDLVISTRRIADE
jgi:hypothetical protein